MAFGGDEVTSYEFTIYGDHARLTVSGRDVSNPGGGSQLAHITFRKGAEPDAGINRGGFLSVSRPLELLGPTMDMLRHDAPVWINRFGNLQTAGFIDDDDDRFSLGQ